MLAYVLAVVHLTVTLTPDFPSGVIKIIPLTIHGRIERLVGPSLIAVPFIPDFANEDTITRNFYIVVGLAIIVIGILTDFQGAVRIKKNTEQNTT